MLRRRGTIELGIKTRWQYQFPERVHGRSIKDMIFIDVGNYFGPGALDQHQDDSLGGSTSELIMNYPEYVYDHLMEDWEARCRKGEDLSSQEWKPTIITHVNPDLDGVVCVTLSPDGNHAYASATYIHNYSLS